MTYDSTKLQLIKSGFNGGYALWDYTSADARATVEGAGYFSNAKQRGMKLGDKVIVCYTTGYVTTIHAVASVSGNTASLNAAVLA